MLLFSGGSPEPAVASLAQGIERLPPEQKVAGSNPAGGTNPETTKARPQRPGLRFAFGELVLLGFLLLVLLDYLRGHLARHVLV